MEWAISQLDGTHIAEYRKTGTFQFNNPQASWLQDCKGSGQGVYMSLIDLIALLLASI